MEKQYTTKPGVRVGKIKWYNEQKGYGFIIPLDQTKDIFFEGSQLSGVLKEAIRQRPENTSKFKVFFQVGEYEHNGRQLEDAINLMTEREWDQRQAHSESMAPEHSECLDAYRKMQEAKTQRQKDKNKDKKTVLSAEDDQGNANKKEFGKNVSAKSDSEE